MSSPLRAPDRAPRRGWLTGASRPALTVVPRLRSQAPRVPFVGLVSILLLGGVIGLLLFNTSMQQASFTAADLEERAATLQARQEALATEIDALSNPTHLAELACAQGLVPGPGPAFLDLSTGDVQGNPSAAVAGPCGPGAERPGQRQGGQDRQPDRQPDRQQDGQARADGSGAPSAPAGRAGR